MQTQRIFYLRAEDHQRDTAGKAHDERVWNKFQQRPEFKQTKGNQDNTCQNGGNQQAV